MYDHPASKLHKKAGALIIAREMFDRSDAIKSEEKEGYRFVVARGKLFEREGNIRDARIWLEKALKLAQETSGNASIEARKCYEELAEVYKKLSRPRLQASALKNLVRLNRLHPENTCECKVEKAIGEFRSLPVKAKGVGFLNRCSNQYCTKIEKEKRQFRACSRCRVAYYCSEACQKVDWRKRHKKVCKTCSC